MNEIDSGNLPMLGDVAAILLRRKRQIAGTFFGIFCTVAVVTFLLPKQYESHMKILVKNERADMIVSPGGGAGSGYHGEVSETEINSEIELLNGLNLLQTVVTKCGLDQQESHSSKIAGEGVPLAIERATTRLQRHLTITPVRKASIIQIDYLARDPRQATSVLRQLAESYLEEHLKVHSTPGTYQFFAGQAERYRSELQDAEARLERFRQEHQIVMLEQQKDATLQKASESEATLMQADAAIREYTYKVADIRKQLAAAPDRVITQNRTVPNEYSVEHLSSMLAELQNRRTLLLAKFRADDRLVQEADKEIADTQAALDKATKLTASEQSTDINPVHQTLEIDVAKQQAELAGLEARRRILAEQVQNYRGQLMALGNATSQFDDLTRNQKEAEENYLLYVKKAEEARIAESLDRQKIANVAIAEPPTEPHLPSKPNVPMNLSLGVLLAGFMSLGVAFGAEYLQGPARGIQVSAQPRLGAGQPTGIVEGPSDLETLTGLPVLATVYLSQRPPG
jgi:uncharacterized protein involved in exopolysaccharide biosynthesis